MTETKTRLNAESAAVPGIGFIVLCLAAVVVLVASQLADNPTAAAVAKLVASSSFLAVALISGALRSSYGRILLSGLVLSGFGDMFLLGRGEALFLAGLVSFLLAHVAYVVAFAYHGLNDKWSIAAVLPIAAISIVVSIWLTPHLPESMVVPVRAYTLVISLMVITAFGARGAGGPLLIPFGAVLFYLSDLSVASLQFTSPEFPNYVWGLPFYYTGQLMLASSVRYAKPKNR